MSDSTSFYGPNLGYALELYDRYQADPNSVDPETQAFFQTWTPPSLVSSPPPTKNGTQNGTYAPTAPQVDVMKTVGAARVARMVRELGHLTAHIDPLGSAPPGNPALEIATHGLETRDLEALPASVIGGPLSVGARNALEALGKLRRAYSGSIGLEDDHIQIAEERDWLVDAIESARFYKKLDTPQKKAVLNRLTEVETFERYLDKAFDKQKRFSIEGTDMLVPMLDLIIHDAAANGTREVVMGMAHRGRLNVLTHILGKSYAAILAEFQAARADAKAVVSGDDTRGWTGDVKYHQGARLAYTGIGSGEMPITLAPNPSHLEFVDPVVIGRARAAQDTRNKPGIPDQDPKASLAILIHGDAAFPGQGIVPETLNLQQLSGYDVGGTIHIITNNQIGFTTSPGDSRSTLYASDLAKGFEIPIIHVNADDVEACLTVARMAHAYREKFGKDFLIDLVGYRRWGHNEGDDPTATQPRMYEVITAHPTVREKFARELENQDVVTRDEAIAMVTSITAKLEEAKNSRSGKGLKGPALLEEPETPPETLVDANTLRELNEALLVRPEGFTANAKLERVIFQTRRTVIDKEKGINWGHAEALAFASILADGTPIRLSGQDSQRGTFGHRHLVLHDPTTGETFTPMASLPEAKASFAVYNSPLSENAVLGFEYGYSMHAAGTLVIWEAQFGDFANGAQVIIDQFIVSGASKWRQIPSLVLLLPHGYEGQGPEHSSARLERFLQLAAADNIRVVNCTDAAQYFHLLRRQAALLEVAPRPLVVMSPKSLLKNPVNASSLSDLAQGSFQPVLDDPKARDRADQVTRLVLCSGKVYYDLLKNEAYEAATTVAAVRVEELYPFPAREVAATIRQYPNLREVVWMQEEPRNMGAWFFVSPKLRELIDPLIPLIYEGRPESASPAEGSVKRHQLEQTRITTAALSALPKRKSK